jgi:hypothetical protein
VPVNLLTLLRHPDSLTVYYYNRDLKKLIRNLVMDVFGSADVRFIDRVNRAKSGFDFVIPDAELIINHSRLVSSVIARQFIQKKEELSGLPKEELAQWLEASLKTISRWPMKKIQANR